MFIPAVIIAGAAAAGVITATTAAILTVISTVVTTSISMRESRRARLRAQEAARHAYNASLRDRTVMVRAEVVPANLLVGRCMVGGIMSWASSYGSLKENYRMTVCFSRHPVDALEQIYFGDELITLDGSGYVQNVPYLQSRSDNPVVQTVTVPGSPHQVTLSNTPNTAIWVQLEPGFGDGTPQLTLQTPADYTVSGTTVTFNAAYAGRSVTISYTYDSSLSWCNLRTYLGTQTTADAGLVSEIPSEWTSSHVGYGIAYCVFSAAYHEDAWQQGLRDVRFVVRGAKLYDPRKDSTVPGGSGAHRDNDEATWEWSNNSALVAAWYLAHAYGVKVPWSRINKASVIAAANICDEDVQVSAAPFYQKRYTCDGTISTGAGKRANLNMICETMAGEAFFSAGQWYVRAGAYTAPTVTIDETWLAGGDIDVLPAASYKELANSAIGTFANGADLYRENQVPEWSGAAYVAEDNGEKISLNIPLPLTTDHIRAQRMLKISVVDSRESMTLKLKCNLRAYRLQPGDMVGLTLAYLGIAAKPMRVKERAFAADGSIDLLLREEPNGKYDWSFGEVTELTGAENSNLFNPFLMPAAPTISSISSGSVELLRSGDGTFVSRMRVAWNAPAERNVISGGRIELQFQGGSNRSATAWVDAGALAGDALFGYCMPVIDGTEYWVRVRFVSATNVASEWTYGRHVAIGKTAAPPNISNLTVSVLPDGTRKFTVTLAAEIPDADGIELRYVSGGSGTWASMTRLRYIPYTAGKLVYDWESSEPPTGTWTFAAKVVDTQGQESSAAGFVNGAVLGQHPVTFGLRANMMPDSDFCQDTGWGTAAYNDARSLPGWLLGFRDNATQMGRNFSGGSYQNPGAGGAYMYKAVGGGAANTQCFVYREIPVWAGVWFEASIYVAAQYCNAAFYLRFVNAARTLSSDAMGGADVLASNGDVTGDPIDVLARPRLWRFGRAPAVANGDAFDTAFAQIIIGQVETRNDIASYTFWTRVMLTPHNAAGLTKENATPWIDNAPPIQHGGAITPGTVTTVAEEKPSATSYAIDGFNNTLQTSGLTWTNDQPVTVKCSFHHSAMVKWDYTGGGSTMPDHIYIQTVVRIGSTYYLGNGAGDNTDSLDIKPLAAENVWYKLDQNFSLDVPAGSTVTFYWNITPWRDSAPTANDTTVYRKQAALQIQAIKK